MKKHWGILGILLLSITVGCGQNKSQSNASTKTVQTSNLTVKNQTFKTTYSGKKKQPIYHELLHFNKNGQFTRNVNYTKDTTKNYIETGSYQITKDKVTLHVQKSTSKSTDKNQLTLKKESNYLLNSKTKQKYTLTKTKITAYPKNTSKQADNTFSNRAFALTGSGYNSAIAFSGNNFIWKYLMPKTVGSDGSPSDDSTFRIVQGTYDFNSKTQVLTLNVQAQSKNYYGDSSLLERYRYRKILASDNYSTLQMKYDNNAATLTPMTGDFYKYKMNETTDSGDSYGSLTSAFSVQTVDSSMKKGDDANPDTNTDAPKKGATSAEEFKDFIVNNCIDPDYIQQMNPTITAADGNGQTFNDPDSSSTFKAKYIVTVDNPQGATERLILSDDDSIFYTPGQANDAMLQQDYTEKYHEAYVDQNGGYF